MRRLRDGWMFGSLVLMTLGQGLLAQDSMRGKTFGLLRDRAGQPWAGAEVVMVSWVRPETRQVGAADVVRTRTDQAGKFRARLYHQREYSVWAWALAVAGRRPVRVSKVVQAVAAGRPVILQESAQVAQSCSVELRGRAPWEAEGPLRCFARSKTRHPWIQELAVDDRGRLTFPGLPQGGWLELRDRRGLLVHQVQVIPRLMGVTAITLPRPELQRVMVRDIDTGKGLAKAQIFAAQAHRFVLLGTTDAQGVAAIRLPRVRRHLRTKLFAQASGYAAGPVQSGPAKLETQIQKTWPKLPAELPTQGHVHLRKGVTYRGRLLLGKDRPLRGVEILLRGTAMHYRKANSRYLGHYNQGLRTDAAGRFVIPACLTEAWFRSHADLIMTPELRAQLPAAWQRSLPWVCPDLWDLAQAGAAQPADLGDVDLRNFAALRLTLRQHDGREAQHAEYRGLRVWQEHGGHTPGARHWRKTDELGRGVILLPAGERCVIAARHDGGAVVCGIQLGALPQGGFHEIVLRVSRPMVVKGRLLGPQGKPAAGVQLRIRSRGGQVLGPQVDDWQQTVQRDPASPGVTRFAVPQRLLQSHVGSLIRTPPPTKTDAQGRFRFTINRLQPRWEIVGEKSFMGLFSKRVRKAFELPEDKPQLELELRLK